MPEYGFSPIRKFPYKDRIYIFCTVKCDGFIIDLDKNGFALFRYQIKVLASIHLFSSSKYNPLLRNRNQEHWHFQTSMREAFAETVNLVMFLTIIRKNTIIDV